MFHHRHEAGIGCDIVEFRRPERGQQHRAGAGHQPAKPEHPEHFAQAIRAPHHAQQHAKIQALENQAVIGKAQYDFEHGVGFNKVVARQPVKSQHTVHYHQAPVHQRG